MSYAEFLARRAQLTSAAPCMGVGSEVYESVRLGRIGIGVELKPSYYVQAERNLAAVDADYTEEPSLIDVLAEEGRCRDGVEHIVGQPVLTVKPSPDARSLAKALVQSLPELPGGES